MQDIFIILTLYTLDMVKYFSRDPQVIKCAEAGADLVRITVQGRRETKACKLIREKLDELVRAILFSPLAAAAMTFLSWVTMVWQGCLFSMNVVTPALPSVRDEHRCRFRMAATDAVMHVTYELSAGGEDCPLFSVVVVGNTRVRSSHAPHFHKCRQR